jgi:hypothetical protein
MTARSKETEEPSVPTDTAHSQDVKTEEAGGFESREAAERAERLEKLEKAYGVSDAVPFFSNIMD